MDAKPHNHTPLFTALFSIQQGVQSMRCCCWLCPVCVAVERSTSQLPARPATAPLSWNFTPCLRSLSLQSGCKLTSGSAWKRLTEGTNRPSSQPTPAESWPKIWALLNKMREVMLVTSACRDVPEGFIVPMVTGRRSQGSPRGSVRTADWFPPEKEVVPNERGFFTVRWTLLFVLPADRFI